MADNQLTVAKLEGGSLDLDTLATFVSGDENAVNHPRLRPDADVGSIAELRKKVTDDAKAKVDAQLKVLPSGHKGYATLAAAQAAQASLPANTLVEVTNDTTTANNGVYLWNGTTLTKSAYGSIADAKTYTDNSLKPYVKTYNTLAELNAVTGMTAGQVAKVTNDATATNIGDYRYSGTAWVKFGDSALLADAKAYAKSYTDGLPLLTNPIVASNDKSKKLVGIVASSYKDVFTITPTINTKQSYLFAVKPSTTYTICQRANSGKIAYREFTDKPSSYQGTVNAVGGADVTQTIVSWNPRQFYGTFTTGDKTTWVVVDLLAYTDDGFIVCEGSYAASMWDGFNKITYNKTIDANVLNVKQINSDMIVNSKNLFDGYNFGSKIWDSVTVGLEGAPVASGAVITSSNYKQWVGAFIAVRPNTTYTISKEASNQFQLVLLKADRSTGTLIMRDVSLRQYTFTTNADTAFIYIYLSDNYEQPLVQVELGDKVTAYESRGMRFAEQAMSLGKLLTEDTKPTDNTYISLGTQTEKFSYGSKNGDNVTYADVLDNLYEPLRTLYPQNIRRNVLGKDSSGTYDIYEYIFEPDNYEQKIVITAGMHSTEIVTPFALGILLNEIYRNPNKHEGLAYLRNKVKIVVIPVVNVWGMNQNPKKYLNSNEVNPSRNFPERWDVLDIQNVSDAKGNAPLDQAETLYMYNVLKREKDNLAFSYDLHTGQNWTQDTLLYWQEDDNFLRPILQNIVSMRNNIVRKTLGREPINETYETQRGTRAYHAWRVFGIPSATIEYGLGMETSNNLRSSQTTAYVDILYNCFWYALKANLPSQLRQAELNEHNKQYISLFGRLTAYNDVVNFKWTYAKIQSELYDKLGLTKTTMAASGSYQLVQYTSAPDGYKNTVVLAAGLRGNERKSVTELMYFAYKLFTDSNPHIVALRNSTRFIILPCLNPWGYDNNSVNNANAVQPYLNFATSTQPESVALRSLIDAGDIDLFVGIDASQNAYKPSGYADCQIIYNPKADTDYQATFAVLMRKYGLSAVSNSAAPYSTSLTKSPIADYINNKGIAYSYNFFAQNVLPKRVTTEGKYVDYGYEADELMYCSEVLFNNIKELCKRLSLRKYLAV